MSIKSQFNVNVVNTTDATTQVTIAASGTVSSVLVCGGTSPMGIFLPSNWTSGNVSFSISKDGINFYTVTNFDGTAFAAATVASQFLPLMPSMFNSCLFIKIISSVSQSSKVIVDFALAPVYKGIN